MQLLGIAEDEPDPFGGRWERMPGTTVLTGVAHEYAEFRIRRGLLSLLPDDALVGAYRAFAAQAVQLGYTSIQDMAVGLTRERAVAVLRAANLPIRVRSICFPLSPDESCDPPSGTDDRITITGQKWITDGTPIERLAYVETAYADRPGWFGLPDIALDPLRAITAQHRTGTPATDQLLFHSVGDAAIGGVLDAMEATGSTGSWRNRRTRIEHGDLLFSSDIARAAQLGIVVVQNGTHLALTPLWAQRVAPQVFAQLEPLRSLLDAGIPIALGTDGIGSPLSPFVDLLLVTIQEALTMEQAVTAYTRGSAYAEFEENRKGTLAPGRLADLAVLSQDIFHAPPPAVPATGSLFTMVGGQVVWDAGVLAPDAN
jgi:predicted amidohydrolase YtcJ